MSVRRIRAAVVVLLCLAGWAGWGAAADATPEAAAREAALAWLNLVDSGQYAESWTQAASLFRQRLSQTQWQSAVEGARTPFGALQSRHLQSSTYRHELPGAPDGDYVVLQFATAFKGKASALETLTAMHDSDGRWRIAGYYIK